MKSNNFEIDSYTDLPSIKQNKEFDLQKYQKFRPNNLSSPYKNKALKGAENKVKNLLSNFLKNYEKEKRRSESYLNLIDNQKNKEENPNSNNNKKFRKVLTASNNRNLQRINSSKDDSNGNQNSRLVYISKKNNLRYSQKRRSRFTFNIKEINNSETNIPKQNFPRLFTKKSYNKRNSFLNKNNINNIKRNKTTEKIIRKEIKKLKTNKSSKYVNNNKINSLIKKNIFGAPNNNNYLNFKNDNITSIKTKKVSFNVKNLFKNTNYNNNNSSNDCSEKLLLKGTSFISSNKKVEDSIINKRKSFLSINKLSKNFNTTLMNQNPNSPKTLSDSINKNDKILKLTNHRKSLKVSNLPFYIGTRFSDNININQEILRLDVQFNSLKDKLKKTIILNPSPSKKKKESKIHNSVIYNNSHLNLIDHDSSSKNSKKENSINLNLIKAINNKQDEKSSNLLLNEKSTDILNIGKQKAIIESSENKSFIGEYSTKRKITLFQEKYRILEHKATVYDSLDDEEIEDQEEITFYFSPNSLFIIIFDLLLIIFHIISLFEYPLSLALNHNFCRSRIITINDLFNLTLEFLNFLDLFFGFCRAYYNWDEVLIHKKRKIACKYLKTWFIFDLFTSIPVYLIIKIFEPLCLEKKISSKYTNIVIEELQYLFMTIRIIKIIKIFKYNQAWKRIKKKINEYYRIFLYIFFFLTAINYMACLYIFIGRNSYPNWIFQANLDSKSFIDIYICSIYVLIMALTTVGYGDITCYSSNERIFQLFILVIGIFGYSFIISFISNYIQKINERSVDYEKKKKILDEIRRGYTNMPENLYDRILRHLKFKNYHEQSFKNIIFECLPIGLKNELISEMYKPIIKNFVFFKYFQNNDFIVKVILAFKPVIASKNDILVNDGDRVEDIMFVKKGVLSVELPINIVDHQENIDKYLHPSFLEIENERDDQKLENKTLNETNDLIRKNSTKEQDLKINKTLNKNTSFYFTNTPKYLPFKTNVSFIEKQRKEKEKETKEFERKKNISYIKILAIRENEHFGDVLMFLEQKSPLRVRVKSLKCELFFLKKIDAVKISTFYQNIWKRINKISVFNYKQMKKSIKTMVEIYSKVHSIQTNLENQLSDIKISNSDKNNLLSNNLNTMKGEIEKNHTINKSDFNNIENNNDLILKDRDENNNFSSVKKLKRNSNNSEKNKNNLALLSNNSSSINSKSNKKFDKNKKAESSNNINIVQKEIDAFNKKYKYVKGVNANNLLIENDSIIKKEAEQKSVRTKESQEDIKNNYDNNYLALETSYEKEINNEFNKDEIINIYKEEDLLNKYIDLGLITQKQSELNKSIVFKNSKLGLLLKCFGDEQIEKKLNEGKSLMINQQNIINRKSKELVNSSSTVYFNKEKSCLSPINNKRESKQLISNFNFLAINNEISFKVESSYENFNIISGEKLIKDKNLQNKIKFYLIEEIHNPSKFSNKIGYSTKHKDADPAKFSSLKNKFISTIKSRAKKSTSVEKRRNINSNNRLNYLDPNEKESNIKILNNYSTLKEPNFNFDKLDKNKNQSDSTIIRNLLGNSLGTNKIVKKSRVSSCEKINNINIIKSNILGSPKKNAKRRNSLGSPKKNAKRRNSLGSPKKNLNRRNSLGSQKKNLNRRNSFAEFFKPNKKRRENLISQINLNIQKTNENLNNPNEFYSNYFSSILEEKRGEQSIKRNSCFVFKNNADTPKSNQQL